MSKLVRNITDYSIAMTAFYFVLFWAVIAACITITVL